MLVSCGGGASTISRLLTVINAGWLTLVTETENKSFIDVELTVRSTYPLLTFKQICLRPYKEN